jgi:radical SAM family uncharacterized protein
MSDDILLQVNKPARYIGGEWNISKKDFAKCNIRFALCFPDLYEVGMSNLGLRIIYAVLNNIKDVCCERFFSLDLDMEKIIRGQGKEIVSLESKKRLRDFDIVGFSLSYELSYTNVLNILDLGNISLRASLRTSADPIVIAGGPCVVNPEPLHDFFDIFIIGEAEEAILELLDTYRRYKDKFKSCEISRQDLLVIFSQLEGVYCPSLYDVKYDASGKLDSFHPKLSTVPEKIKKRFVRDLNSACFPLDWLLPYIQIIHDRITLEIMRGCPNRCRFCQARTQYFPFRQRSLENILRLAESSYAKTGYEEISLAGLSISDYTYIEELILRLIEMFKKNAVSVSLPSIKAKVLVGNLSSAIATIRKTGLTFAPEAASERLRKVLAKDFDSAGFFQALEQVFLRGYRRIKLYFMIGLPFEEDKDLEAIVDLAQDVSRFRKKLDSGAQTDSFLAGNKRMGPAQVNISVNTLIPKPHTPFQWLPMPNIEIITQKHLYLRQKMRNVKNLKLNLHNPQMTILECVLSRGDRRLSKVILCAFQKGARFDAWENHFMFTRWQEAFSDCGIDPNFYLQARSVDDKLPWDFMDLGISKEILVREFKESMASSS